MYKTFSSTIPTSGEFNEHSDVCVFLIALAFRRGITASNTFDKWYSSVNAKLGFKEEQLEKPVFTKYPR
jgi:MFS-type transporter involved in bile tolerance (Atg22 family)